MNFNVGDVLPARYDLFYVIASYVISVVGAFGRTVTDCSSAHSG